MTAEVLREAAKAIRGRATAATPGPWECMAWDSGLSYRYLNAVVITEREGDRIAEVNYDGGAEGPHGDEGADAAYIASWHPVVAFAVADWLDACALVTEVAPDRHKGLALAVARAYLGSEAGS